MTKLRLSDWANIAEVVGALAVVLSLIYVGIQVRDNTEAVRASNRQQLVDRAHSATNNAATSPELAAAIAKLSRGEMLTPAEHVQYSFFVRAMLYDVQEAYLLYREGRLDERYWKTRSALFSAYMEQSLAQEVYSRDKGQGVLHQDFVTWADSVLQENP